MHNMPTAIMDAVCEKPAIAFRANEAAYSTRAVRSTVWMLKAKDATILVDLPKRSSKYWNNNNITSIYFVIKIHFYFICTLSGRKSKLYFNIIINASRYTIMCDGQVVFLSFVFWIHSTHLFISRSPLNDVV